MFVFIIRPHRSTTYVDAACCYRQSSVVCWSVCHSSEPCKMAEPVDKLFALRTWIGPRNHVLGVDLVLHGKGQFLGKGRPLWSIWTVCRELCKNGWTDRDAVWVMDSGGPKEMCIRWGSRSPCEGAVFLGERTCQCMPDDTLPWAVQKWLNRSRCRLDRWLGWAEGSMCYMWGTLTQPGKCDWIVRLWQWCSLMSNYLTTCYCYFAPGRSAKYCDVCVCMYVSMSARVFKNTCPNFTKFSVRVIRGHGLVSVMTVEYVLY